MKDEKTLIGLIGTIYLCGSGNADWQDFLDQFGRMFPALKSALTGYDRLFSNVEVFCTTNYDLSYIDVYAAHYYKVNAWKSLILASPPTPRVAWGHDAVPIPELEKTEFYADWLRPQENIATGFTTMLFNERDRIINLAVNVSPKNLREAEVAAEAMKLIGPHLQRAFELNRQLIGARIHEDIGHSALDLLVAAVFIVDPNGKIRLSNAKGECLLREEQLVRSEPGGRLRFLHADDHQSVMESVRRASLLSDPGDRIVIPLHAQPGRRYFSFVTMLAARPSQPALGIFRAPVPIAVFVIDSNELPRTAVDHIAAAFKVTPAEARLALALLQDKSLPQFADETGISIHTARAQMRSLLEKTETHRQTQLVRLLANVFSSLDWSEKE